MSLEIERKWLLKSRPDFSGYTKYDLIHQGYLCNTPTGEVRVRKTTTVTNHPYTRCTMTIKQPHGVGHTTRNETECVISLDMYEALKPTKFLMKARYDISHRAAYDYPVCLHEVVVDRYILARSDIESMCVLEVEFDTEIDARHFKLEQLGIPPGFPADWISQAEEVTNDKSFKNANLVA